MSKFNIAIGIILLTIILVIWLVIWVVDSYCTYKRLNKQADELISDTEMSLSDKRECLLWHSRNAIRQANFCFPIFRGRFIQIANKLYNADMS